MDENNFNYYEYIYNYKDLRFFNYNQAYRHYLNYGKNEGRIFNTNNLHDFDPVIYKNQYDDLISMTEEEATIHYIRFGKYEGRNYKSENIKMIGINILIIACHIKNLIFIDHLNNIKEYFNKIYLIYSVPNENIKIDTLDFFKKNPNIELKKVENIGYDFKKYLIGINIVLNDSFNKLWLINDSFIIYNWKKNIFTDNNIKLINESDYIGLIQSNYNNIKHFQSYFLILNKEIVNIYKYYLENNIYLLNNNVNEDIKNEIIDKFEVKLSNSIITNNKYKSNSLIQSKTQNEVYKLYVDYGIFKDIDESILNISSYSPKIYDNNFNQSMFISQFYGIYKIRYLSISPYIIFLQKYKKENFELILNLYFHTYEPFVRYFNYFYYKKINLNTYTNDYLNLNEIFNTNNLFMENIIDMSKYDFYVKNDGDNIIKYLSNILKCSDDDIYNSMNVIKFIKNYKKNNKFILDLKYRYFYENKVNNNLDNLISDIIKIQNKTKNKKLIYTNNINFYDTFWDIEDDLVENDIDYIYISNIDDINVCKNFIHLSCNLNSTDTFYLNRYFKFNKKLFNCYEKILYIDSNVKINKKLNKFFDLLDDKTDIILFKHPDRNTLNDELIELINSPQNYSKWNLDIDKIEKLRNEQKTELNNQLYWLNIQLSNTKYNLYDDINELYNKYNLKRDQILFSINQKKYKIKIIEINKSNNLVYDQNIKYFDGDYGYIDFFSNYFSRPFGGLHI